MRKPLPLSYETPAPRSGPGLGMRLWLRRRVIAAAGVLAVGVYLAGAVDFTPIRDGLVLSLCVFPLWLIVFALAYWLIGRLSRNGQPGRWVIPVCVLLSILLVAWSYGHSRPGSRFGQLVVRPAPPSLEVLEMQQAWTMGEGSAWFFKVTLTPEDFERMVAQGGLEKVQFDWDARRQRVAELVPDWAADRSATTKEWAENMIYPEDAMIRVYFGNIYRRPESPEYFRTQRIVVVTDLARSTAQIFVDRLVPPEPRR